MNTDILVFYMEADVSKGSDCWNVAQNNMRNSFLSTIHYYILMRTGKIFPQQRVDCDSKKAEE